jgi:Na+/melibiose symporter-like transporter
MGYVTDHYPFFYNFLLFGIFAVLRTAAIWFVIPSDVVQQRVSTPSTEYTEPDDRRAMLEEQLLKNVATKWDDDEEQTGNGKEDSSWDGEEQHREEEELPDATCHELCRVLMQPTFLFLLFEVAVIGMGIGVVERLLFVYLQRDLQASTFLCGLTVLVTVVFELPIFTYTDWLLTTLGKDIMFIVAMLAYVVRALG